MEDLAKIILRVKKLLALSSSPNQHEAEQASVMAFELMSKYSIEMSTVEGVLDNEIQKEELLRSGRIDRIVWDINQILDKYFYVTLVRYRSQGKSILRMVGKKHRIEIAKHIFHFLYESVDRAWNEYRKTITTYDKQDTLTRKYYFSKGFLNGVAAKLEVSKVNLQEKGLVIVRDVDLDAYMKQNVSTKTTSVRRQADQHSDGSKGYERGKSTDLFNPVAAGSHFKSLAR